VIWGPKTSARIKFVVPEEAMQHVDRDDLLVCWGVSHRDYETLSATKGVPLSEILRNDPKSARDTVSCIRLRRSEAL